MRNKLCYLFLCMLVCFSFINNVFADDLDFTVGATVVGGSTTVVKKEEVTVNVNVKSDLHINACSFKASADDGIEFVSSKEGAGYVLETGSDGTVTVSGNDTDTATNMTLLQLRYKVNNDGKITIKTLNCTSSAENKTGSYEDVVVELKTIDVSKDTTLSKLVVNGGTLSPSFSSDVKSYSIKLDSTSFSLTLTASNSDYQDDIVVTDSNGNKLDPSSITFNNSNGKGQMPIVITVNNDTKYNLLVVYEEKDLDNSLKSLKVDGKTVNLEDGKYDYTVTIGSSVSSIKIEAILMDDTNFKFTDEFDGTQIVQTPSNSTSYPIIIEPSNSQVGAEGVTYTIKLVKESSGAASSSSSNSQNNSNNQNTSTNPSTGGISMVVMMIILMASLIGSIVIYQKNLEGYNNK